MDSSHYDFGMLPELSPLLTDLGIAREFKEREKAGSVVACAYARTSRDHTGEGASVEAQIQWCRLVAQRRGWDLSEDRVWADNNIGASRYTTGGKERSGWKRLKSAVDGREVHVVIMTEVSRGARTQEWYEFVDLCEARGVMLCIGDTLYDPSDPDSRLTLGINSEVAQAEVRRTRRRVLLGKKVAAVEGRPSGRPEYGFMRVYDERGRLLKVVPHPEQAPIGAEVIRRIAAWEPYSEICSDLNNRGVPVPSGKPGARWAPATLTQLARSPRWVGKRVVGGVLGPHGRPYEADPRTLKMVDAMWPAVVEWEVWSAALDRIYNPQPRVRSSAQTFLSGLLVCGVCGAPVRAARRKTRYVCAGYWLGHPAGQGHVSIKRSVGDEIISAAVIARLSDPRMQEFWRQGLEDRERVAEARQELARLQAEIDQLPAMVESGEMSWVLAAAAEKQLMKKREELEAVAWPRGAHLLVEELAVPESAVVEEMWRELPVSQRRAVLTALTDRVELLQVGHGGRHNPLAPEKSFRIVWK